MQSIRDFTGIETIYQTSIRTVRIKIRRDYIASPDTRLDTIRQPDDVYTILQAVFATLDDDQEHLIILVLNRAQEVTGYKLIASGGQGHALIDCKIVFRNALLMGASGIILAHNHPGGNLEPSVYDIDMTRKVVHAGSVVDIEVIDHLIYTMHGYTSLRASIPSLFEDDEA